MEAAQIFEFGGDDGAELLYSRRVGRASMGTTPSAAAYSEMPEVASILGAAKLTERKQKSLSIDTRLNVTFMPKVTLELYAQPFISSGNYEHLMELRARSSFAFNRNGEDIGTIARDTTGYTIDADGNGPARSFRTADRDFNFQSLRRNAVLPVGMATRLGALFCLS